MVRGIVEGEPAAARLSQDFEHADSVPGLVLALFTRARCGLPWGLGLTGTLGPRRWWMLTGELVGLGAALACSGERYARPSGPAPSYEAAPVLAWDAGSAPEADLAGLDSSGRPRQPSGSAARLWTHSAIHAVSPRVGPHQAVSLHPLAHPASDERRQIENVTND